MTTTEEWTEGELEAAAHIAEEYDGAERHMLDTFLENRRRARLDAEAVDVEQMRRLTEIPEEHREPFGQVVDGWRFGHLSRSGAITSPFSPDLEWPREGLQGVCTPPTSSRAERLRVLHAHTDSVPVDLCSCGIYYAGSPAYLFETYGGLVPQVFYEVQAWGRFGFSPEDRGKADGEHRAQYVRVKPGGRMLIGPVSWRRGGNTGRRRSGPHEVAALRERYGVNVEIVKGHKASGLPMSMAWLYTLQEGMP